MDHITKAVRLAQQKRISVSQSRSANESPSSEIVYTKTYTAPISADHLRAQRILSAESDEPIADAYRLLRTRVMQRMEQNRWNTLGITSPAPKEGKTLTAINLAISMARELNHTVLLIDADLRRPSVAQYFGLSVEYGLVDHLLANKPIEELLVNPGINRLVILPGGKPPDHSSELLASRKMMRLIEQIRNRYTSRFIIFDLPPVLVGDDVVAIGPNLDALLLVLEDGKTETNDILTAGELLENVNILGTVLNKYNDSGERYQSYYY